MTKIPRVSAPAVGGWCVLAVLALGLTHARPSAQEPAGAPQAAPFQDLALSFEARARDLVSRMTIPEKIAQLMNEAPAIPRLGVPAYDWWNECLHGVARAGAATVFPQAIGMAASFDAPLMREVATAISDEARAKHHDAVRRGDRGIYKGLTFWSPNINIFRDPRWGRGQETYGEDPYLTARMGVEFVKGLQGDDPRYLKVVATAKHFAVHSGPEADRHHFDARPSERDLYETYLPAFRALVTEAHVASVMSAYNRLDGDPAPASQRLLGDILRREWGFGGYVVSDCGAIDDIYLRHHFVPTPQEAAALGVTRGCDLECGSTYRSLATALDQKLLTEQDIDVALTRLMLARFRLGMFDPPERVRYASIPPSTNESPEHDRLARRMAQASIVLLENDGVLPLSRTTRTIAVVGPSADDPMTLLGNYYGTPSRPVTILAGIRSAAGPGTKVLYARGADLVEGRRDPRAPAVGSKATFDEALDAARASDVVVFVGGLTGDVEGEEMRVSYPGFAGGDRVDIGLPATQDTLLKALQATGKPVVPVLTTGSALAVERARRSLPAILVAWYPGQQGGAAVADVLFGAVNPSGRLPVTFYRSVEQLPPFADYSMKGRTYRYFDGEPLYPFGHGLSYTRFRYSELRTSPDRVTADRDVTVSVAVTNAGARAGHEVVQVYSRAIDAKVPMPIRQLCGFERVWLEPGQTRTVRFRVAPAEAFSHYDEARKRAVVDPGEYALEVGASSRDIRVSGRVRVNQ
jgi:beta-glucosidase